MNDGSSYHLFIVLCQDESLFTGITKNLGRRLSDFRSGRGSRYVAARLPCALIYTEPHSNRWSAWKRELQIRRMSRQQKLALIRKAMDDFRVSAA